MQEEEKGCLAEADAIGIRIPVQKVVLVEEKAEDGAVAKIDKDNRGKLDGVSIEELVKITRILTRTINTGRAGLIAALRTFRKATESKEVRKDEINK